MTKNLGTFNTASTSETIKVADQFTHVFTVISSNVSGTVNVRIEYSYDLENWYNVSEDGDYNITTNEPHNLIITKRLPTANLRFKFVSGTGDLKVYYINY